MRTAAMASVSETASREETGAAGLKRATNGGTRRRMLNKRKLGLPGRLEGPGRGTRRGAKRHRGRRKHRGRRRQERSGARSGTSIREMAGLRASEAKTRRIRQRRRRSGSSDRRRRNSGSGSGDRASRKAELARVRVDRAPKHAGVVER